MKRMWVIGFVALAAIVGGCAGAGGSKDTAMGTSAGSVSPDRAARLLVWAKEEMRSITEPEERLKWFLNMADIQIRLDRGSEARKSLEDAALVLRSAKEADLERQKRLGGWISISELSRMANDKASANKAVDEAVSLLNRIEPATDRCPYVRDIAAEIKEVHGEAAGAKLLVEGAQWASKMEDDQKRSDALVTFAIAAYGWAQDEAVRAILSCYAEPGWRILVLTSLAYPNGLAPNFRISVNNVVGGEWDSFNNKSLSYEDNFKERR